MKVFLDCLNIAPVGDEPLHRLAPAERRLRAERCRDRDDARRCLAAGILLQRAARRMGFGGEIVTEPNRFGKPRLVGAERIEFSISHGGDWVLLGYGETPIGVDVEPIARNKDYVRLAERFFSAAEREDLLRGEASGIPLRFARTWTAKESYVKYLGCGFAKPPASFSADPETGRVLDGDGWVRGISLRTFSPDPCHIAAVCGAWDALDIRTLTVGDMET